MYTSSQIKENIIRECRKISGTEILWDEKRIDIKLPSDRKDNNGKLVMIFPGEPILLNLIDISSQEIPAVLGNPGQANRALKINYCASGRCELRLHNGECTYLTAGEIAVDAGQAMNTFYYPSEEYKGFETVVYPEQPSEEYSVSDQGILSSKSIYDQCQRLDHPWIRNAEVAVSRMYDTLKIYISEYENPYLIKLSCLEMIALMSQMDYRLSSKQRTYCTAVQAEIAKITEEILISDLSVRITAGKLAEYFGISETSLKNYFRNVYGYGYGEYQQKVRMKEAAKLLQDTDDKVSEIAQAVGFSSQAKFGAAFKEYFSVTPLEFRRRTKLSEK